MPKQRVPAEKSAPCLVRGIPANRTKVSCAEAAKLFVISAEHVRCLCESGQITADPVAGRNPRSVNYWSIPVSALADFVRRRTIQSKSQPPAKPKKRPGKKPA